MIWWIRISKCRDNTCIVCFYVFLCRVFVSMFKSSFLRWKQIFILQMSELHAHQMLLIWKSLLEQQVAVARRLDLAELRGKIIVFLLPLSYNIFWKCVFLWMQFASVKCVRIFNTARVWRLDTSWPVTAESSKIPQVGVLNRHPGLLSDTPPSLLLHADMSETPCFLSALSPHHPNNVNLRDTNFRGLLICRPKRTKLWRERDDWVSFFPPAPQSLSF